MLTDAILREATAEAERFLLSIVPEDGEPHEFSKRFQRKMEKLIRRTNHPIRYQVMRTAAAVALAIVTLFGAVMAVSPEARAAVVGWIKETFGIYTHYSNDYMGTDTGAPVNDSVEPENSEPIDDGEDSTNSTEEQSRYEYKFSVIPEGYRELKALDKLDGKMYIYVNDSGCILQFTYTDGAENSSLFADTENYEHYSANVNECAADIYIALKEGETSGIVWEDSRTDMLFQILATAERDVLIGLAETVTKIEP